MKIARKKARLGQVFHARAAVFRQASIVLTATCKPWFWALMFCSNTTASKYGIGDVSKTAFKEWGKHALACVIWNEWGLKSCCGTLYSSGTTISELGTADGHCNHTMTSGQRYASIKYPVGCYGKCTAPYHTTFRTHADATRLQRLLRSG